MSRARARLADRFRRIFAIEAAAGILQWDQAVWMPRGGAELRGRELATLARIAHDLLADPVVGEWLAEAEADGDADPWVRADLREMRRRHLRARAVDPALVERLQEATTRAELVWREARARSDFTLFAPRLAEVVDLVRERARQLGTALGLAPYDALLDGYQPGLGDAEVTRLFAPLARHLPHLVEDALARRREPLRPAREFPPEAQRRLARELVARLGFDFDHGRLDESTHPFCGGAPPDVRMTARYDPRDPLSGIMAVIHETGHALYSQGLPRDRLGLPVGEDRGIAVHESQSLLMEMKLARSRPFLHWLAGRLEAHFGPEPAFAPDNLVRLVQRVERGCIRVDADELTYPLHVILRWRLERALLAGELAVSELPAAWREGMAELLGVVPPDDRRGVLQDIHWSLGAFGYFPCYTVGALLAARLFAAMRRDLADLDEDLAEGRFERILAWLRRKVHARAARDTWTELVREATGGPLDVDAFFHQLHERYGVRRVDAAEGRP